MPTRSPAPPMPGRIYRANKTEFSLLPAEPQRADALVQIGALHPQHAGGAGDVPPGLLERLQNMLALGRFAGLAQVPLGAGAARDADLDRHRLGVNEVAAGQNRHALDRVAQLTDVARP